MNQERSNRTHWFLAESCPSAIIEMGWNNSPSKLFFAVDNTCHIPWVLIFSWQCGKGLCPSRIRRSVTGQFSSASKKHYILTSCMVNCRELHKEGQTACYGLQSGSHSILLYSPLSTCDQICTCYHIIIIVHPPWWKTKSVPCCKPYVISVVCIQIFMYSHS